MDANGSFNLVYDTKESLEKGVVTMMALMSAWENKAESSTVRKYDLEKICNEEANEFKIGLTLSINPS